MTDFCPLQHPPKDATAIVTQFSAYPLDGLGLLKMDFLGLRNLTIIDRALRIIENNHGVKIDVNNLPMDDQKVFDVFASGDTTGIFQFDERGTANNAFPTDFISSSLQRFANWLL